MINYDPFEVAMIFGWSEEFVHRLIDASILPTSSSSGEPTVTLESLEAFDNLVGRPQKHPINRAR